MEGPKNTPFNANVAASREQQDREAQKKEEERRRKEQEAQQKQREAQTSDKPKSDQGDTEKQLEEARENVAEANRELREATRAAIRENRPSGLDSFQQYQKERTEEEIQKRAKENPDSVAVAMSPEYSPGNTVRGTEGDNANFDPERAAARRRDRDKEYDIHGGENEESKTKNYEPKKRPE